MTAPKLALPSFSFQAIRGKDEFWDEGIRTTADACEPGNKCRSEVCPEHTPPSVYRRFQGRAGGEKFWIVAPLRAGTTASANRDASHSKRRSQKEKVPSCQSKNFQVKRQRQCMKVYIVRAKSCHQISQSPNTACGLSHI